MHLKEMNSMKNGQAKVLIIDDDKAIGEMLKTMLEFSNYKVAVSDKPLQAKESIKNFKADLVILDVRLSGIDGTEVCDQLKKDDEFSHVPILMMSALTGIQTTCKNAGADGFIAKPFEMDELLMTVQQVLASQRSNTS